LGGGLTVEQAANMADVPITMTSVARALFPYPRMVLFVLYIRISLFLKNLEYNLILWR
jgi:hypothetical protein